VSYVCARLKSNDSLPGERGAKVGVAKRARWANFAEVRQSFNTADFVARFVVFDIGGNKYRLIAEINFSRRVLFIRGILTHKEYVKGAGKS
jgi:mRNA interferase HigB